MLPGFTDSHVHFPTWALTRRELQLHGTREEVLARVAEAAPRVPRGRWLRGFGWTGFEPSLEALDAVSGDVPVALLAHDWHSLWVNSAALAHAKGDLERPGGVVDLEAGVLREEAAWSFRDRFTQASHEELVEATRAALPVAAARGVTAIHDKDGLIGSREVFAELELPFRVWQSLPAKRLDERPDYVKAYMDGTLGSQTARLLDGSGVEITSRDEFEQIVRAATAAGVPVAVHAIGDLANREALDVFEAVPDAIRPRIEHAQCVHPDDIPRFAQPRRDRLDPAEHGGHRRAGGRAAVGGPAGGRLRLPLAARLRRPAGARVRRAGRGDGSAAGPARRRAARVAAARGARPAGRARGADRHARVAGGQRTSAAGSGPAGSPT